jgi:hypothetical protein
MGVCVVSLGIAKRPLLEVLLISTASLIAWTAVYIPILKMLAGRIPAEQDGQIVLAALFFGWGLLVSMSTAFKRRGAGPKPERRSDVAEQLSSDRNS